MNKRRMKDTDALRLAIDRERGANKFYRNASNIAGDSDGKIMFGWLAKEEARHLAKLRQQLKSVIESDKWLEWRRATTPIDRTEFHSASEVIGTIGTSAGEMDALHKAIESEQEAIIFYKKAEDSTPDLRGKSMFKSLAAEEEGHLALLEEESKWITQSHKHFTLHRFTLQAP